MDLQALLKNLENCPCGKTHTFDVKRIEIERGLVKRTGEILAQEGFPKRLLLVCDRNTLNASEGILPSLEGAGFEPHLWIYPDLKYARVEEVRRIEALASDFDAILSVGTGSLNDICRVAAYEGRKRFCIFATAPSMDGFASDTAPIVADNFKTSWQAAQPEIILADTEILARAPGILKAAGFGDMIAKIVGLCDWKIAALLHGDYYCDRIAAITGDAYNRIVALADKIQSPDPDAAGQVMEALVLTGLAMKLAGCSRPASGAEHIISHYLECHKLLHGIWPDYHGRKVGVATLCLIRVYRNIAERVTEVHPVPDPSDLDDVYAHYDPRMHDGVKKMLSPMISGEIPPELLREKWQEIREIILTTLPDAATVEKLMKQAGAATGFDEVNVSESFRNDALRYHSYMRHRVNLTTVLPMLGIDPVDYLE